MNKPLRGVFNEGVLFVPFVWVLEVLFALPLGVPFVWPVADPLVDPSGAAPAVQQNVRRDEGVNRQTHLGTSLG